MKIRNIFVLLLSYFILTAYFTSSRKTLKTNQKGWRKLTIREKRVIRDKLVKSAEYYAGKPKTRTDCSGLILKILNKNNITIFKKQAVIPRGANGVKIIYLTLKKYKKIYRSHNKASPGDLIFFNNTYDKNKNKRVDDPLTHIAMITEVNRDGTIKYIHKSGKGIIYGYMNLRKRNKTKHKNKVINSYLRRRYKKDSRRVKYLSAQLFNTFGTIF